MSLLTPLGFLGLIGIGVLILIYLLKPNYQQKVISSSYVWKLSLKYRKKKLPISRFRNILTLICQVLAILTCTMILTQPFIPAQVERQSDETIAIIDASAHMRATSETGETRFSRAVLQASAQAEAAARENILFSVILAGEKAEEYILHAGPEQLAETQSKLRELIGDGTTDERCSYSTADIDGAMQLAEKTLNISPDAEILLYTATEYLNAATDQSTNRLMADSVEIRDMRVKEEEWNAAILDCTVVKEENYYGFEVEVASYGRDQQLWVYCVVDGANEESVGEGGVQKVFVTQQAVKCARDETVRVGFIPYNMEYKKDAYNEYVVLDGTESVTSFQSVHVYVSELPDGARVMSDSLRLDDDFYVFGGKRLPLRIQYCSSKPNNFFRSMLLALSYSEEFPWDVQFDETSSASQAELTGYDLYIFEHEMPTVMPEDGVVILMDLSTEIPSLDFTVGGTETVQDAVVGEGVAHPLTQGIDMKKVQIAKYNKIIVGEADSYAQLAYCNGSPVILAKNEADSKVVLLPFDLNWSNMAILPEFPALIYNIFDYYFPQTVTKHAFDVGETIALQARSVLLSLEGGNLEQALKYAEFPAEVTLSAPGVYTLTQTPISGKMVNETVYVRLPASESNIFPENTLNTPVVETVQDDQNQDLVFWFALALVLLLLLERWAQSKEQF